jgi:hypothetical protein
MPPALHVGHCGLWWSGTLVPHSWCSSTGLSQDSHRPLALTQPGLLLGGATLHRLLESIGGRRRARLVGTAIACGPDAIDVGFNRHAGSS